MKKLLYFILTLFWGLQLMPLHAQQLLNYRYYEPNTTYTFRSLDPTDVNYALIMEVRFDSNGKAHITRSREKAQADDLVRIYAFAPAGELLTSSSDKEPITIKALKNQAQYFEVSFEPNEGAKPYSGGIEVSCNCTLGSGTCDVAAMIVGNTVTAECVPEPGCKKCKINVNRKSAQSSALLLVKASEVIFE